MAAYVISFSAQDLKDSARDAYAKKCLASVNPKSKRKTGSHSDDGNMTQSQG